MKARLKLSFAVAGTALILLTGCVSSRKYKASEASLAQARSDSAQLAQQVTSLNGNVNDLRGKNDVLQRSLDSSSNNYTAQQRSLDYYRNYFKAQQDTMTQVSGDVRGALTQAGISNGDVQQTNNAIYVSLDENELFKKNSTMVTPVGKRVLDTLAQVIQSRTNVNVTVGSGDSAVAWTATGNTSDYTAMSPAPTHHRVHHRSATTANSGSQSAGSGTGTGSVAANSSSTGSNSSDAPVHKKVHHHYSAEGSMAIYSGTGHLHNRAWALKQGRMVSVADHFLHNGMPKVNISLQQPPMNGTPGTTIKIIIKPAMNDFSPQLNSSAAAGTR